MLLDKDAVKEAADIAVVADEIGIDMEYRQKKAFILCPFHNDMHFGSCYLLPDNRFKCHSCGASGDVFDLVQKALNLSFTEAVRTVADICGGAEHFVLEGNIEDIIAREKFISRDEQKLIGICDKPIWIAEEVIDSKDEAEETESLIPTYNSDDECVGYCVMERVTTSPLFSLFKEDPDTYHELIDQFCKKAVTQMRMKLALFRLDEIYDPTLRKVVTTTRALCGDEFIATFFSNKIAKIQHISVLHGNGALVGNTPDDETYSEARPLNADMISSIQNSIWEKEQVPF